MQNIILNITKPTTLKLVCLDKTGILSIKLHDARNGLEYERYFKKPQSRAKFNIPVIGRYNLLVNCKVALSYFDLQKNELPILPKFDRVPNNTNVKFVRTAKVGSPASINIKTKTVFLHANFFKMPKYIQRFIVAHEIGHLFYNSEKYTDLWATHYLLSKGYNYSQSVNALKNSLTGPQRNERIKHNLTQVSI